jgi:hypothetical protein
MNKATRSNWMRSNQTKWCAVGLVGLATLSVLPISTSGQDGFEINEAERMMSFNTIELKDQLYFGLRTFLPEQQAFLDVVIAKVESRELSRAMVNVVFVWSKKRNPKIPFPYFQTALTLLAEKRGVTL